MTVRGMLHATCECVGWWYEMRFYLQRADSLHGLFSLK